MIYIIQDKNIELKISNFMKYCGNTNIYYAFTTIIDDIPSEFLSISNECRRIVIENHTQHY